MAAAGVRLGSARAIMLVVANAFPRTELLSCFCSTDRLSGDAADSAAPLSEAVCFCACMVGGGVGWGDRRSDWVERRSR